MKDIDCLIVGYAGVDRIIKVDGTPEKGKTRLIVNKDNRNVSYGGNGSNVAACLAKLGCKAAPLMRVGWDWEKLGYKQTLLDYGVDISGVDVIQNETTSICHLIESPDGSHLTMTYPGAMNGCYASDKYDERLFERAKYGIVTVATAPDIEHFISQAEKAGLPLVFGVRVDEESFSPESFRYLLLNSEIIFMNEAERDYFESHFNTMDWFMKNGHAKHIVITLGEKGCLVMERNADGYTTVNVPALKNLNVVDTTGAGDSFIAGYMYGYLHGENAAVCAMLGNVESSFIIEQQGCITGAPDITQLMERYVANKEK